MSQVLREQLEGGVTLLRINRSERLNALSVSVREELAAHINASVRDQSVRCIVITGDEKAFAAEADAPLSSALLLERKAFQLLFATDDKDEGIRACKERRQPQFEGR
jgi:enoyl-CoA hydratase/carnithine racemase